MSEQKFKILRIFFLVLIFIQIFYIYEYRSGFNFEILKNPFLGYGFKSITLLSDTSFNGSADCDMSITIDNNVIDEANLKVSNSPTNGYVLTARSGNTGGMTWEEASGGGATGGSSDKIFQENGQTVTANYTIGTTLGAACNAMSAGPITVNSGVTVTIDSGDNWIIV